MNDKMRAEFEEWWRREHGSTLYCQSAWRGWRASRAALEREVEALRSLLSDVTCIAITMLYDTHKQDVLDEFTMDDLKEVVRRSEHLQVEKVEHIYRRGFEALATHRKGGDA